MRVGCLDIASLDVRHAPLLWWLCIRRVALGTVMKHASVRWPTFDSPMLWMAPIISQAEQPFSSQGSTARAAAGVGARAA